MEGAAEDTRPQVNLWRGQQRTLGIWGMNKGQALTIETRLGEPTSPGKVPVKATLLPIHSLSMCTLRG